MPATSPSPLGDFLRASRARLDPGEVGLISAGNRRVAGLRREQVAVLAGYQSFDVHDAHKWLIELGRRALLRC